MSNEQARQESCLQVLHPRDPDSDSDIGGRMQHLIIETKEEWDNGKTLTVTFFDDPKITNTHVQTPRYRHLVEHYARIWERWANIKFKFVDDDEAIIKISSGKVGSWSTIGKGALHPYYKTHANMNLDVNGAAHHSSFSRATCHEFGHAIGCKHEQQNPHAPYHWIEKNVVDWYTTNTTWEDKDVYHAFNNFKQYKEVDGYESTRWDSKSIMHYHMEKSWTEEGIVVQRSDVLSDLDKEFIGKKYPFSDSPVSGAGADKLLDRTAYAAIDGFEYREGKMYLNLFCQSDSYSLYKVTYLFRHGSPTIIESDWETERIKLPLHGAQAPAPGTPLAVVRYSMGDFKQVIHLFYLDRDDYIRDCIFVNGELKSKNRLNTKVASYSRLSAVAWQGKDEEHIRLFYQSARDDHIQEYIGVAKWNGTTSSTTWSMGAVVSIGSDHALPGTDFSFVNLTWDTACIRGFYQNTDGAIRQTKFTGGKWSLVPNWQIRQDIPYATSFAAMVFDKGVVGKHKPILYYKAREYDISDDQYIYKVDPEAHETEGKSIGSTKIAHNSRIAFIDSDVGDRVFFTSPEGKLTEKISPGKGKSFATAKELKFDWSSNLGQGGKDDGWGDDNNNDWDKPEPVIIQPQKPGPPVGSGKKGPFGW
ncbi:hypothetical protein TWF481_012148 [Arthrobotrys musiformis]|uniref:Fucose-specific lectin n=1 Tax=Arthrobotrys musiformis TaxID=47236 RepID=A0AAV9VW58_9PEZI